MIRALLALLGRGGIAAEARAAFTAALDARSDAQLLEAQTQWQRVDAAVRMAEVSASAPLSAVALGRYLVVIPWGIWWAAIMIDSTFNCAWDVLALPSAVSDMAGYLVPAILLADVAERVPRIWRAG